MDRHESPEAYGTFIEVYLNQSVLGKWWAGRNAMDSCKQSVFIVLIFTCDHPPVCGYFQQFAVVLALIKP
eukprot:scaffold14646_cov21-Prasinocladus_malaysianus.AAC.2